MTQTISQDWVQMNIEELALAGKKIQEAIAET